MQRKTVTGGVSKPITLVADWPGEDEDGEPVVVPFAAVNVHTLDEQGRALLAERTKAGQVLTFTYHLRNTSLKDFLDRPDPTDQDATVRYMAEMLAKRLADWDLMDGKEKVPAVYDEIVTLPFEFINGIFTAMNADQLPKQPKS